MPPQKLENHGVNGAAAPLLQLPLLRRLEALADAIESFAGMNPHQAKALARRFLPPEWAHLSRDCDGMSAQALKCAASRGMRALAGRLGLPLEMTRLALAESERYVRMGKLRPFAIAWNSWNEGLGSPPVPAEFQISTPEHLEQFKTWLAHLGIRTHSCSGAYRFQDLVSMTVRAEKWPASNASLLTITERLPTNDGRCWRFLLRTADGEPCVREHADPSLALWLRRVAGKRGELTKALFNLVTDLDTAFSAALVLREERNHEPPVVTCKLFSAIDDNVARVCLPSTYRWNHALPFIGADLGKRDFPKTVMLFAPTIRSVVADTAMGAQLLALTTEPAQENHGTPVLLDGYRVLAVHRIRGRVVCELDMPDYQNPILSLQVLGIEGLEGQRRLRISRPVLLGRETAGTRSQIARASREGQRYFRGDTTTVPAFPVCQVKHYIFNRNGTSNGTPQPYELRVPTVAVCGRNFSLNRQFDLTAVRPCVVELTDGSRCLAFFDNRFALGSVAPVRIMSSSRYPTDQLGTTSAHPANGTLYWRNVELTDSIWVSRILPGGEETIVPYWDRRA